MEADVKQLLLYLLSKHWEAEAKLVEAVRNELVKSFNTKTKTKKKAIQTIQSQTKETKTTETNQKIKAKKIKS